MSTVYLLLGLLFTYFGPLLFHLLFLHAQIVVNETAREIV